MSISFKGSQTEKNLMAAFAGESQARNRYTFFASAAKKEGLIQMSAIFEETANQEKEHAERFWKFLKGGKVEVMASFPAGTTGDTLANLKAAAAGEKEEWSELYPSFEKTAREEGFGDVADAFKYIIISEKQHEKRYLDLYKTLASGKVFKKDGIVTWRCRNCGYLHQGKTAPMICPACLHAQAYFEILSENY